jgi:hypothetical protein
MSRSLLLNLGSKPVVVAPFVIVQAVQNKSAGTTVTTLSPTIAPVTPGNLVVVTSFIDGPSAVGSITDSLLQTWTTGPNIVVRSSNFGALYLWYKANSAAITTLTVNSTSASDISIQFWEIAGPATSGPLDVSHSNSSGGSTGRAVTNTASGATAYNPEFAIGAVAAQGGPYTLGSVTAGWNAQPSMETTANDSMNFPFSQTLTSEPTLALAGTLSGATYWGNVFATFHK